MKIIFIASDSNCNLKIKNWRGSKKEIKNEIVKNQKSYCNLRNSFQLGGLHRIVGSLS